MTRTGAVVAGHICLDIIPELPTRDLQSVLKPGGVVEIGRAVMSTGGPVSNTGLSLHLLGIPVRLMAKVGTDEFGQIILDQMREHDPALTQDMIIAAGEISSYTLVLSPQGADRAFMHCTGANRTFGAADVPYESLRSARLFHFGYPPVLERMFTNGGVELAELFRRAHETGVITSLDMCMPDPASASGQVDWRAILARTLPHVDLFLPSLDELLFMVRRERFDSSDYDDAIISEIAGEMLELGARVVALKLGARGFYVRTGADVSDLDPGWQNRELWAPVFVPESLVGTTGAGDATIAGFLAALLRDQPLEAALTSAVAVGACNVEALDALSGVQSWEATQARIAAGWARGAVTPSALGWTWNAAQSIWVGPHDRGSG